MNKGWKIALYVVLILAIISVVWLMFGNTNIETQSGTDVENLDGVEISNLGTNEAYENTDTFEEDVMKDLEGFFGNNNGYEDVEGEYGFTNPENE